MTKSEQEAFNEEMNELIFHLEKSILALENDSSNTEIIADIFRALHTIKGICGMSGDDDIAEFAHQLETVYDYIRQGKIVITKQILDFTFKAADQISAMAFKEQNGKKINHQLTNEISKSVKELLEKRNNPIKENKKTVKINMDKKEDHKSNSSGVSDVHKQAFIEEASELIVDLEKSLLDLEKDPKDKDIIARVFRALHTIKGSSGMFGYDEITMFTHDIESVYDKIRNEEIFVTKQIIDLTLKAIDQISLMLFQGIDERDVDEEITHEIITSFRGILNNYNNNQVNTVIESVNTEQLSISKPGKVLKLYYLQFEPNKEIFMTGTNPASLIAELKDLGDVVVTAGISGDIDLTNIDPEACYFRWRLLIRTLKEVEAIKDVFIFVEDQSIIKLEEFDLSKNLQKEEDYADFINNFIENSFTNNYDVSKVLDDLVKGDLVTHKTSSVTQQTKSAEGKNDADKVTSIRVSSDKLDELVNLVGELVTIQARLTQLAISSNDQNYLAVSEEVERITWSLRDSALNIRMLPIGTTFNRFNRLVRDLSKELNKEINLSIVGAETELDKTVIERLNDPLIHIIRNSIDHGIEPPEVRRSLGKPSTGEVKLSATQSGGNVLIRITDDGAGLDKEAIRQKAISSGILQENVELTDSELYQLIFAPGFSTAKKVTNVSGRGVGMDVVKKAIESLRGSIDVQSKKNEGTSITLKLPLTLAIIDGLLVRIADDNYVLPLSSVEECIELKQSDIDNVHGRHVVNIRGEIVPYLNLRQRFEILEERPEIEQVVIASVNNTRVGFVVDFVVGQHQTVLKTLGKFYNKVEGISGATILGDGTVALILDIVKLVEQEIQISKEIQ